MANEGFLADLFGYKTIVKDGGIAFVRRAKLDFRGPGVAVEDDPVTGATRVTISGTGGGGGGEDTTVGYKRVRLRAVGNVDLAGLIDVDEVPAQDGDLIMVGDNVDPTENGVYIARDVAWERAADFDDGGDMLPASLVGVAEGMTHADTLWIVQTDEPVIIGVSAITFIPVAGGDAISLRGTPLQANVGSPVAGRLLGTVEINEGTAYGINLRQLVNADVASNAALAVNKLAGGVNGNVLKTISGVPAWQAISLADVPEVTITADAIATDQDDFTPVGWSTASIVRLGASAFGVNINGFGPATVKRKTLLNILAENVSLTDFASGQTAGNQIRTPGGATYVIPPKGACTIFYDATSSLWKVLAVDPFARANIWPLAQKFSSVTLAPTYDMIALEGTPGGWQTLPLTSGQGSLRSPGMEFFYATKCLQGKGAASNKLVVRFPVRLPKGALWNGLRVSGKSGVSPIVARAIRLDPSTSPLASDELVIPLITPISLSGAELKSTLFSVGEIIDNELYEYHVEIELSDESSVYAELYQVAVNVTHNFLTGR